MPLPNLGDTPVIENQRLAAVTYVRNFLLSAPYLDAVEEHEMFFRRLMFKILLEKAILGPIAAMLESGTPKLITDPDAHQLILELLREAYPVIRHYLPIINFGDICSWLDVYIKKRELLDKEQMLLDVLNGRETEIDISTGWIIEQAEKLGLPNNCFRTMRDLVNAKLLKIREEIESKNGPGSKFKRRIEPRQF